jgi:carboxymethylenebutenolidase
VARLTLDTLDGPMALDDVASEGDGAGRAVIVIQEAYGVTSHILDVAGRLAAAGHRAVVPHIFHRTGDPVLTYGDFGAARPHMDALSQPGLLADLDATLAHLAGAGYGLERVGIVGFCMGGSVSFLAAASRRLGAAVTFYGGGVAQGRMGMPPLMAMAPSLLTPWLGLYGDRDTGIPVEQVEALRGVVAAARVPTEIVRYPEAGHGFHCDDRPDAYHEASARDAWSRALAWLERPAPPA